MNVPAISACYPQLVTRNNLLVTRNKYECTRNKLRVFACYPQKVGQTAASDSLSAITDNDIVTDPLSPDGDENGQGLPTKSNRRWSASGPVVPHITGDNLLHLTRSTSRRRIPLKSINTVSYTHLTLPTIYSV